MPSTLAPSTLSSNYSLDLSSAWYHGSFVYEMPEVSGSPKLTIDVYASEFPDQLTWDLVSPKGDVNAALDRVTDYLISLGVNVYSILIQVESAEFTPFERLVVPKDIQTSTTCRVLEVG